MYLQEVSNHMSPQLPTIYSNKQYSLYYSIVSLHDASPRTILPSVCPVSDQFSKPSFFKNQKSPNIVYTLRYT